MLWCAGIVLGSAGITALAAWGSFQPSVTLSSVTVQGNAVISDAEIRSVVSEKLSGRLLGIFNAANVFLAPLEEARTELYATFPRLSSIQFTRISGNKLSVSVSERKPFGLWCKEVTTSAREQQCYFFDAKGVLFAEAPHFTGNVFFTVYGEFRGVAVDNLPPMEKPFGMRVLPAPSFNRIRTIRSKLNESGIDAPMLRVDAYPDYAFVFANGTELRFTDEQAPDTVLHNLGAALNTEKLSKDDFSQKTPAIEYVDVRFGSKVFVK